MILRSLLLSRNLIYMPISAPFSNYKKIKQAFYDFLNFEAGAIVRNAPEQKDRKYKHVEISKQFKEIQQKRKQERLIHLQKRKQLLETKLRTISQHKMLSESKRLGEGNIEDNLNSKQGQKGQLYSQDKDEQKIKSQLDLLKQLMEKQEKEIKEVEEKLEVTEAEFILVTQWRKIVILNKIQHLKYLDRHPSGVFFNPEILKNIQNVHYLVTNNLPVNRYKLYELMPQLFQTQVAQLQQSTRRLIQQKYLKTDRKMDSDLQFFLRKESKQPEKDKNIISIQSLEEEREASYHNMTMTMYRMLYNHQDFIDKVNRGDTIYRSTKQMIFVLLSEKLKLDPTKLTEEQIAIKKTLQQIILMGNDWLVYSDYVQKLRLKIAHMYQPPPEYIANHPVLKKHWEEVIMPKLMNPESPLKILPQKEIKKDLLEEKIRQYVSEHFDKQFEQIINTSKSEQERMEKMQQISGEHGKKMELIFYKKATQVLEQLAQIESEEQYFQKLPKTNLKQSPEPYLRISSDELTKMIHLNNKDPQKYSLEFFSKYFGIDHNLLGSVMNKISYLRIDVPSEILKQGVSEMAPTQGIKDIKSKVIKFIL